LAEKLILYKVNSSLYYGLLLQSELTTYSTDVVDIYELKRL